MYLTHSAGKSVVVETFIRTLTNKIYKHMTAISKNIYFDFLNDIVDRYHNTYHRTIQTKPIDIRDNSFAEYNGESNEKDSKFKVDVHVRISKYKNIFAKGYTSNWSEEIFVVKNVKNTLPWTYVISDLKLDSHLPKLLSVNCLTEIPLKMMKNAFYFILKALFVLKIFKFLARRFSN